MALGYSAGLKMEGKIKLNSTKKPMISLLILQFFGTSLVI